MTNRVDPTKKLYLPFDRITTIFPIVEKWTDRWERGDFQKSDKSRKVFSQDVEIPAILPKHPSEIASFRNCKSNIRRRKEEPPPRGETEIHSPLPSRPPGGAAGYCFLPRTRRKCGKVLRVDNRVWGRFRLRLGAVLASPEDVQGEGAVRGTLTRGWVFSEKDLWHRVDARFSSYCEKCGV